MTTNFRVQSQQVLHNPTMRSVGETRDERRSGRHIHHRGLSFFPCAHRGTRLVTALAAFFLVTRDAVEDFVLFQNPTFEKGKGVERIVLVHLVVLVVRRDERKLTDILLLRRRQDRGRRPEWALDPHTWHKFHGGLMTILLGVATTSRSSLHHILGYFSIVQTLHDDL